MMHPYQYLSAWKMGQNDLVSHFVSPSIWKEQNLANIFIIQNRLCFSDIRRILIPRFFRTLFDGGVSDVYFLLKQPKPLAHIPAPTLDCEQTSMVSSFGKPAHIKVSFVLT